MQKINKEWILSNKKSLTNQKCVTITGAGISVSSGVPDFRSKKGIFAQIKEKYNTNGTELFKYSFGFNPQTRPIYLKFISEFKQLISSLFPSFAHKALKHFLSFQKKSTVYSQNICGLEKKAGIVNLVNMHGDTDFLKCMQCGFLHNFTESFAFSFSKNEEIPCSICKQKGEERRRVSFRGYLHPNIVHYEEEHPNCAELIDKVVKDRDLTFLIVIGTSLKPYGIKQVIKYFSSQLAFKEEKRKKGTFVSLYVNTEAPNKVLSSFFTHFWHGSVESFFKTFFEVMGDPFEENQKKGPKVSVKISKGKEIKRGMEEVDGGVKGCKIKGGVKESKEGEINGKNEGEIKEKEKEEKKEEKLLASRENPFQSTKCQEDVFGSFVEEISSFIKEFSFVSEKEENGKVTELIKIYDKKENEKENEKEKEKENKVIFKEAIFKKEEIKKGEIKKEGNKNVIKKEEEESKKEESVDKQTDLRNQEENKKEVIKKEVVKEEVIKKEVIKEEVIKKEETRKSIGNKYRTIILQEDGQLQVKLPTKQNLTPTLKKVTKANPRNYSPLLKKTKKKDSD